MKKERENTMFKKLLMFLMASIMIIGMGATAFAEETPNSNSNDTRYQEYIELVKEGILDEEVTFEYWQELKERSTSLESELEDSAAITLNAAYSMKAGDVFITNATSSYGLTGHAGIAISSTRILHIAGPGHNPVTVSLKKWHEDYTDHGWTKVYRHADSKVASAAASWAEDTYRGSDAEYLIDMNLRYTEKTYCSKIVWQAYYYGPDSRNANGPTTGIRLPYDLPMTIHDLSLVKTF